MGSSGKRITGTIHGIENFSSVMSIDLSSNLFEGTLDLDYSKISTAFNLNLRSNKFTGTIPNNIKDAPRLRMINLSNNNLEGEVKEELKALLLDAEAQIEARYTYTVLKGFEVYTGKETLSLEVDAPYVKFERFLIDGVELDKSHYVVTEGSTIITLTNTYAKTLLEKEYKVSLEFSSQKNVETTLVVKFPSAPKTGIQNDIITYLIVILLSVNIFIIINKKGKTDKKY